MSLPSWFILKHCLTDHEFIKKREIKRILRQIWDTYILYYPMLLWVSIMNWNETCAFWGLNVYIDGVPSIPWFHGCLRIIELAVKVRHRHCVGWCRHDSWSEIRIQSVRHTSQSYRHFHSRVRCCSLPKRMGIGVCKTCSMHIRLPDQNIIFRVACDCPDLEWIWHADVIRFIFEWHVVCFRSIYWWMLHFWCTVVVMHMPNAMRYDIVRPR
jgi:hypothetical protein